MHTFEYQDATIFHDNSIHSTRDVHMQRTRGPGFTFPQQALVAFVAQLVAGEKVARLEQATPMQVLGLTAATTEQQDAYGRMQAAVNAAYELLMSLPGGHQYEAEELQAACAELRRALL